ncbi:hypothetical protein RND71_008865 [Anisodus tanguticus]|uniref:Nucleotide exchange factor Fes1 domain-containing protein n=1 Tax=Anisodus tanguticus TaxID=243964 RepID=A0AAE1VR36_9SOLA|nr:hypothetical protein RND71_008865 [Anisodus tanguticus]
MGKLIIAVLMGMVIANFASIEGTTEVAVGHLDPGVLKERSEVAQRMSLELESRQTELKELMQKLKMPSDVQLMLIAVNDLDNSSLPLEHHHRALEELLVLVEHIDNAIDLQKLGGFSVLIRKLDHSEPEIRTAAEWVLGKASQNNPIVQKQMMKSHTTEEAVKALLAISALIRNNLNGQDLFYREAGDMMLQEVLSNSNMDIRLHKKSLFLIADLAKSQLENENTVEVSCFSNRLLLKAMVDSMASSDLDLQEKALERTRQQLQQFMVDDDLREYATDVESLRKEVELTFLQKLDKVPLAVSGLIWFLTLCCLYSALSGWSGCSQVDRYLHDTPLVHLDMDLKLVYHLFRTNCWIHGSDFFDGIVLNLSVTKAVWQTVKREKSDRKSFAVDDTIGYKICLM